MKELSITEKVLVGAGAVALTAAAAVGIAVLIKKHKKTAEQLAEIVCDCEDEICDSDKADEEAEKAE